MSDYSLWNLLPPDLIVLLVIGLIAYLADRRN